ncbi:MAG: 30S ribosomal protein S3 [Nitrospirae bacterium]|nr:30S ribosomal protein S3 [Nitrospirota bacterium]
MGQKVNPIGFRLKIVKDWTSRWYAEKDYATWLHQDLFIRDIIQREWSTAGISKVEMERSGRSPKVIVHTSRPGMVIGKKGVESKKIEDIIEKKQGVKVEVEVREVRRPETDAQLVSQSVARQLESRISYRRAMRKAIGTALQYGALGVKIMCAGRLGGSEIARREWYREGRVPLHTLRADIDFGVHEAHTKYGVIGVKVWIFKGEVLEREVLQAPKKEAVNAAA